MLDPWAEATLLVYGLENDYGVVPYLDANDDLQFRVLQEVASKKPLSNPEVKKLMMKLLSYPKLVLRTTVHEIVVPKYTVREV